MAPRARAPIHSYKPRGKQGVTRQKLIDATVELVRTQDLAELTTAKITKRAGIAQPGFYAHFKNIDDCVQVAMAQAMGALRARQGEARRRALARIKTRADITNVAIVRASFADTLEVVLSERNISEIFLRYRRHTSLIGKQMSALMESVRDEILNDLWSNARAFGFRAQDYPRVAFWADELLALYLAAAEALLDGRFTDKDMIFDSLARHTCAILESSIPALKPGRSRKA